MQDPFDILDLLTNRETFDALNESSVAISIKNFCDNPNHECKNSISEQLNLECEDLDSKTKEILQKTFNLDEQNWTLEAFLKIEDQVQLENNKKEIWEKIVDPKIAKMLKKYGIWNLHNAFEALEAKKNGEGYFLPINKELKDLLSAQLQIKKNNGQTYVISFEDFLKNNDHKILRQLSNHKIASMMQNEPDRLNSLAVRYTSKIDNTDKFSCALLDEGIKQFDNSDTPNRMCNLGGNVVLFDKNNQQTIKNIKEILDGRSNFEDLVNDKYSKWMLEDDANAIEVIKTVARKGYYSQYYSDELYCDYLHKNVRDTLDYGNMEFLIASNPQKFKEFGDKYRQTYVNNDKQLYCEALHKDLVPVFDKLRTDQNIDLDILDIITNPNIKKLLNDTDAKDFLQDLQASKAVIAASISPHSGLGGMMRYKFNELQNFASKACNQDHCLLPHGKEIYFDLVATGLKEQFEQLKDASPRTLGYARDLIENENSKSLIEDSSSRAMLKDAQDASELKNVAQKKASNKSLYCNYVDQNQKGNLQDHYLDYLVKNSPVVLKNFAQKYSNRTAGNKLYCESIKADLEHTFNILGQDADIARSIKTLLNSDKIKNFLKYQANLDFIKEISISPDQGVGCMVKNDPSILKEFSKKACNPPYGQEIYFDLIKVGLKPHFDALKNLDPEAIVNAVSLIKDRDSQNLLKDQKAVVALKDNANKIITAANKDHVNYETFECEYFTPEQKQWLTNFVKNNDFEISTIMRKMGDVLPGKKELVENALNIIRQLDQHDQTLSFANQNKRKDEDIYCNYFKSDTINIDNKDYQLTKEKLDAIINNPIFASKLGDWVKGLAERHDSIYYNAFLDIEFFEIYLGFLDRFSPENIKFFARAHSGLYRDYDALNGNMNRIYDFMNDIAQERYSSYQEKAHHMLFDTWCQNEDCLKTFNRDLVENLEDFLSDKDRMLALEEFLVQWKKDDSSNKTNNHFIMFGIDDDTFDLYQDEKSSIQISGQEKVSVTDYDTLQYLLPNLLKTNSDFFSQKIKEETQYDTSKYYNSRGYKQLLNH